MRTINRLVVHCSATDDNEDIGVDEITAWHKAKGWETCGYHYVIRRDGRLEVGRTEDAIGAHAVGHNANSIGICLIGGVEADNELLAEFNYSRAQMHKLEWLLDDLLKRYPNADVLGHKDLPGVKKACPCMDTRAWWYGNSKGAIA